MKNRFLLIVAFLISLASVGQTYNIFPSNKLNVSAPYNEENKFKMYITNISSTTLTLQWKVISNNLVAGWDCFICDNVSCCKGVPESGILPYIDPGIDVYLALNVNPKAISGMGILKLYLYEAGNPFSGDTLTWVVNSTATGLNQPDIQSTVTIFPNPASEYVMIDRNAVHSATSSNTIFLYNSLGQLLIERKIDSVWEKLDITALPNGAYKVVITDDKRNQISKTLIIE